MVHIFIVRENGGFVKQFRGWFDVNGTYGFEEFAKFKRLTRLLA